MHVYIICVLLGAFSFKPPKFTSGQANGGTVGRRGEQMDRRADIKRLKFSETGFVLKQDRIHGYKLLRISTK